MAARGQALVSFAFVLTGGDRYRAEDLVQSAIAKVMRRWSQISGGGNAEAYLRRAIVSEDLSWHRRRSSREDPTERLPERGVLPSTDLDERDAVLRLLATLPRRQRAVLVLRYLEDYSDAQIAECLGCSQPTVRSQATRALAHLRAELPLRSEEGSQP